jgi:DNA-binding response OmpR family regulator
MSLDPHLTSQVGNLRRALERASQDGAPCTPEQQAALDAAQALVTSLTPMGPTLVIDTEGYRFWVKTAHARSGISATNMSRRFDLIHYLALHPGWQGRGAISAAIYGKHVGPDNRLDALIHRARQSLRPELLGILPIERAPLIVRLNPALTVEIITRSAA